MRWGGLTLWLQRRGTVGTAIHASSCTTAGHVSFLSLYITEQLSHALFTLADLQGWQLDKLAAEPKRAAGDASASDSDSDDEDIPFACLICRKPYTDPVATRCDHYFCAACAIRRFARTPKCAACGAPTGGIFNRADKVIAKLKKGEAAGAGAGGEGEGGDEGGEGGVQIEGLGGGSDEDE